MSGTWNPDLSETGELEEPATAGSLQGSISSRQATTGRTYSDEGIDISTSN